MGKSNLKSQDKEFEDLFSGMIPALKKIGWLAQGPASLTAAFTVFTVAFMKLSQVNLWAGIIGASLITLSIILIIHGGLRYLAPFPIRQLVRWQFKNRWFVLMFFPLFLIVGGLAFSDMLLSWWGGPAIVEAITPEAKTTDIKKLSGEFASSRAEIVSEYGSEIQNEIQAFDDQEKTIREKYEKKVKANRRKAKQVKESHPLWSAGLIDNIPKIQARMDDEILKLQGKKTKALQAINLRKDKALDQHSQSKSVVMAQTIQSNSDRKEKLKANIETWGGFLALFSVCCTFITLFCITMVEVYERGKHGQENGFGFSFRMWIQNVRRGWNQGSPAPQRNSESESESGSGLNPESGTESESDSESEQRQDDLNQRSPGVSNQDSNQDSKVLTKVLDEVKAPPVEVTEKVIFVEGFSKPMNKKQLTKKLGEYRWKNANNQGKRTTNDMRIKQLTEAISQL